MENKICLDTDFLVNFLRKKKEEVEFIKENEEHKCLATTYINLFELYYGANKMRNKEANLKVVGDLMERLNMLNLSNESTKKAGSIKLELEKKGNTIDFRDLFIGTIALTNGYSIKTKNKKHFERIGGLTVL